jgi:hypothetical protein
MYMDVLDPHRIKSCKVSDRNVGYYNERQKAQILSAVNGGI